MASCWWISIVLLANLATWVDSQTVEGCQTKAYPPPSSNIVPKYTVNLDLPPEQRWTKIALDKKVEIQRIIAIIKNITESVFHGKLIYAVDKLFLLLTKTLPSPYKEEIEGIANVTGLPVGEICLYNVFYELFSVCTSIIIEDSSGKLYHGRNLDFGLFLGWDMKNHTWLMTEALRPLVMQLSFQKNGKTIYRSVGFAGYIGILTAMKNNAFSLTVDERFTLDGGFVGVLKWLLGYRTEHWLGFLTRQVMENADSYYQAQKILSQSKLISPVYFILGGNKSGEACVITRDRGTTKSDIWTMKDTGYDWFILETNYDHWKEPPFYDNRRTPTVKCLKQLTQQNAAFPGLFNVLSSKPALNQLTTYTALMQVNAGSLESYLQYCSGPCSPW